MRGVKVVDKTKIFVSFTERTLDRTLNNAAIDIIRLSKMQVPHRSGNLQSTGNYVRKGLMHFEVQYNASGLAPYARRWEYTTPPGGFRKGRKSRYLRDPSQEIASVSRLVPIIKSELARIRV